MLDTIVYIPTILAYAFITLLIVILGFIVMYISHKIYISVYDNLPVPDMRSSTFSMDKMEKINGAKGAILRISNHATMNLRKSKTDLKFLQIYSLFFSFHDQHSAALRIIVTLEPCYLAYVIFDAGKAPTKNSFTALSTAAITTAPATTTSYTITANLSPEILHIKKAGLSQEHHNKLFKYFDRLSDIPRGKVMEACPHMHSKLTLSVLSSVFDSVIRNAVLARRPSPTLSHIYNQIEEISQLVVNNTEQQTTSTTG